MASKKTLAFMEKIFPNGSDEIVHWLEVRNRFRCELKKHPSGPKFLQISEKRSKTPDIDVVSVFMTGIKSELDLYPHPIPWKIGYLRIRDKDDSIFDVIVIFRGDITPYQGRIDRGIIYCDETVVDQYFSREQTLELLEDVVKRLENIYGEKFTISFEVTPGTPSVNKYAAINYKNGKNLLHFPGYNWSETFTFYDGVNAALYNIVEKLQPLPILEKKDENCCKKESAE